MALELDLAALVRNRTLSPSMAALFEAIGRERRSFLVFAVPRQAGKTTLMRAILECAPPGTPLHVLDSNAAFAAAELVGGPGYLVIPEVAPYAVAPGYLWGEPVRRAFALLAGGLSLATALHAPDLRAAIDVLGRGNGVPPEALGRLEFAIEIRMTGGRGTPERFVHAVHQLRPAGGNGGEAGLEARLLHRRDDVTGAFEALEEPTGLPSESRRDALVRYEAMLKSG